MYAGYQGSHSQAAIITHQYKMDVLPTESPAIAQQAMVQATAAEHAK